MGKLKLTLTKLPPRRFCAHCIEVEDPRQLSLCKWEAGGTVKRVWLCADCQTPGGILDLFQPDALAEHGHAAGQRWSSQFVRDLGLVIGERR
jgi:hypothetical protein